MEFFSKLTMTQPLLFGSLTRQDTLVPHINQGHNDGFPRTPKWEEPEGSLNITEGH